MTSNFEFNVTPVYENGKTTFSCTHKKWKYNNWWGVTPIACSLLGKEGYGLFKEITYNGTVVIGDNEYMYNNEHYRHTFYDGDEVVYRNQYFDRGVEECMKRGGSDEVSFKDFKGVIVNPVRMVVSTKSSSTPSTTTFTPTKVDDEPDDPDEPTIVFPTTDGTW